MTPEMLEKLAVAREKAMLVRRQIKAEKDAKELEELPAKLEKKAKIKADLAKENPPKPEFRTKKTIPEDNPVMDSPDDSDASEASEPPPVKTKKKKKIVVVEESSSDEETYVYVPKRPPKGVPQNPKAKYVPSENITPAPSVEDYKIDLPWEAPPQPIRPPPPPQPTYNELARANLHTFGTFGRRF
jgi:hypothetical protein